MSGNAGEITLRPIGIIRTPFREQSGTPVQPQYAGEEEATVILDPSHKDALDDLDGFHRVWLLFWMDRAGPYRPRVVPYRDTRERGLFATRSPSRPNPIGISVVRLLHREECTLHVAGIDILDGTPLLDIKPYVPAFDAHPSSAAGWLDSSAVDRWRADGRFERE